MNTRSPRSIRYLCAAACGLVTLWAHPAPAQEVVPTAPIRTAYVIEFSGAPGRGVLAGNFENFAFTIDLKSPRRMLSVKADDKAPDVVATFDYADCSRGQEPTLERPLAALRVAEAAWIDYLDVELLPHPQRELKWSGGVCYGARGPNGQWRWNLVSTPLAYDAATDRVRARLWIKDGPITAIKLVFDNTVPRQHAQKVTLVAEPYGERKKN